MPLDRKDVNFGLNSQHFGAEYILKIQSPEKQAIHGRIGLSLDFLVTVLATYFIPITIFAATVATLVLWENIFLARPTTHVTLQVLSKTVQSTSPLELYQQIVSEPETRYFDTRLSEAPIWFAFHLPKNISGNEVVEFPSRHAVKIACWDSKNAEAIGNSENESIGSTLRAVKAGFALTLNSSVENVLCRGSFIGPARISAEIWDREQFDVSVRDFYRRSGLTEGGLLLLAAFLLISAAVNRNGMYLWFAVWLVTSTRLSATAGGWDDQWLNHSIPAAHLPLIRSITRGIWVVLTITIFKSLFQSELVAIKHERLVRTAQWLSLLALAAPFLLPRELYYPTLWIFGGFVLVALSASIVRIVLRTRSPAAVLYAAAFVVTLLSTFAEILAAAFGLKGLSDSNNGVISALATGLLAALAMAEQMRQEHLQRVQAQVALQQTYDAVPVGLFTLDLNGRLLSANPAMHAQLGNTHTTAVGRLWGDCFPLESWTNMKASVQADAPIDIEINEHVMPDTMESHSFVVRATLSQGKIEGSLQDVTEKVRAAHHLEYLANFDSLTKSLNRRGIEAAFKEALDLLGQGSPLALAYLDLDRFKLINDLYGRNAGDDVLQHMCSRVLNVLPKTASLGRMGGDEFLLLMPGTSVEAATSICRRVIETVGLRPYGISDKAFHVRGSIGLLDVMPDTSIKDAISVANRACRQAKVGSGEGLVIYEKNTKAFQEYEAEITLVELLATPEATQGLHLVMQPIMSLVTPYDSLNFEVLLRMRDAQGKPIRTDHLIKAAESSGRMSAIDRWVLTTTLNWLNEHYQELKHTKFICMNLNGASLNDERFLDDVVTMLATNQHVAHHLCYEITESVALQDLANTQRFISKVRSFGAKVALDDFGAGYTSFSYLKDLPADLLKIDGSFIVDMNLHPANVAIVEAIVSLAGNLGMKTIAEWAEDVPTVQTLRDIGVDYVQGFVVARPQDPSSILGAMSSASFINNDQLTQVINHFGKSETSVLQVDLFDPPNNKH